MAQDIEESPVNPLMAGGGAKTELSGCGGWGLFQKYLFPHYFSGSGGFLREQTGNVFSNMAQDIEESPGKRLMAGGGAKLKCLAVAAGGCSKNSFFHIIFPGRK